MLFVLMILVSFAEVISIGLVLPFLAALTAPERVFMHPSVQTFVRILEIREPMQLLFPLTVAFCLAAFIAGSARLLLLWANTRLSFAVGADLSISMYRRTLYQPYEVHIARNSSAVVNGIWGKTGNAISVINMCLNLMSSFVILIAILGALLIIDAAIAVVTFGGFGVIYCLIILMTRRQLILNSSVIARESDSVVKSLQEGLGGIRDILINGSQDVYCQIYRNSDQPLRRAQSSSSFISSSPRSGMEILGMLLLATLAYTIVLQEDGVSKIIPVLGAFALGAQRLLPVLQQAYAAWSSIQSGQSSLKDTLALLDQPIPDYADLSPAKALEFRNNIKIKEISFRYSENSPWVFKNLNLYIAKGSRLGFIGVTGSGKSTLLDMLMGLLQPTDGVIEVDGHPITLQNQRNWQANIAHVPQTIYLADSTIEENIAFGIPNGKIDFERVKKAAKQAQIADIIESWPQQYQTIVGERGVRLSGGQRQRIGIARALYKQADVLILDEATSALDSETEESVMQAIDGLSNELTLLIIAHRVTTLKGCNKIVELSASGTTRVGTYHDIFHSKT